jgi:hypothetical protein
MPRYGESLFGDGIHKQNAVIHLVSNEKNIDWARVTRDVARKQKACEKGKAQEAVVHNSPFERNPSWQQI